MSMRQGDSAPCSSSLVYIGKPDRNWHVPRSNCWNPFGSFLGYLLVNATPGPFIFLEQLPCFVGGVVWIIYSTNFSAGRR
jgi:hypothetical protein